MQTEVVSILCKAKEVNKERRKEKAPESPEL
jgi:hypothetical protein